MSRAPTYEQVEAVAAVLREHTELRTAEVLGGIPLSTVARRALEAALAEEPPLPEVRDGGWEKDLLPGTEEHLKTRRILAVETTKRIGRVERTTRTEFAP